MARRKSWTVLFYIIARSLDLEATPGNGKFINRKADEVVDRIKKAAQAFSKDIYVAYQVVFDTFGGRSENWFAELLNADDDKPTTHGGEFKTPGVPDDGSLTGDLLGFYAWALPRCPADHCATFFWGHSAGPAGLIKPSAHIIVPALPGSAALAHIGEPRAIRSLSTSGIHDVLMKSRRVLTKEFVADKSVEEMSQWILTCPTDEQVLDPSGAPVKVDVVLFQDCWMSTLETAFQLKDAAHFAVASQSLVPFGRPSVRNDFGIKPTRPGAGVWPYHRLFGNLLNYESSEPRDSLRAIVDTLGRFYDDSRNVFPNPSVPFSLLDLDTINSGTTGSFDKESINTLVRAIKRLMPDKKVGKDGKAGKRRRGAFIERASLAVASAAVLRTKKTDPKTELAAGSIALIDVIALCRQLEANSNLKPSELKAVKRLLNSKLVVACKESIYRPAGTVPPDDPKYSFKITRPDGPGTKTPKRLKQLLGFQGVSALYFPTPKRLALWGDRDNNIWNDLDPGFYEGLTLSQETDWKKLALEQKHDPLRDNNHRRKGEHHGQNSRRRH